MPSINVNCSNITKAMSPIEEQINSLENKVRSLRKLSDEILIVIRGDECCSEAKCCDEQSVKTVAGSIADIGPIASDAENNLREALDILREQLGSLKLKY